MRRTWMFITRVGFSNLASRKHNLDSVARQSPYSGKVLPEGGHCSMNTAVCSCGLNRASLQWQDLPILTAPDIDKAVSSTRLLDIFSPLDHPLHTLEFLVMLWTSSRSAACESQRPPRFPPTSVSTTSSKVSSVSFSSRYNALFEPQAGLLHLVYVPCDWLISHLR